MFVFFQVSGEGKPRGAVVHHPEPDEGQQPEGLHAQGGSPGGRYQQGEEENHIFFINKSWNYTTDELIGLQMSPNDKKIAHHE